MIWPLRTVKPLEKYPTGMRVCWFNVVRDEAVCTYLGLHLLFRWPHRLWEWSILYRPSRLEKALMDAYNAGYWEGWDHYKSTVLNALEERRSREQQSPQ